MSTVTFIMALSIINAFKIKYIKKSNTLFASFSTENVFVSFCPPLLLIFKNQKLSSTLIKEIIRH